MAYNDLTLQCSDCGHDFIFTAGEQEFYASKGLSNQPKRCPDCRSQRRNVNKRSSTKALYDAICDDCGCETQVPFKPTPGKSVYCKECFTKAKQY